MLKRKKKKSGRERMTADHKEILLIERTIHASTETVYDAFTSMEALKQWFGPGACFIKEGTMNFEVGGVYEMTMVVDEGEEIGLTGRFEEIDPPHKLVYTWRWVGANADKDFPNSKVTLTFVEQDGATRLTLLHEGLPTEKAREEHNKGWSGCFDKLGPYCNQ